jgi:hypothetical protein
MIDLKRAFGYPLDDEEWVVKIIIGIVLSIIPIINFFALGYTYRIFKKGVLNEELSLPEWDQWGELFIQGFLVFLIRFIYLFIPKVIMGSGIVLLFVCFYRLDNGIPFADILGTGALLLSVGFVFYLLMCFFYPMALANYARNDEQLGAAFHLGDIIQNIFRVLGDYVLVFILMFCLAFVAAILSFIPYLGILIALAISFYLYYLIRYALYGMACSGAYLDEEPRAPSRIT